MIRLFDGNMNECVVNTAEYLLNIFPLDNFSAFGLIMDGKYFQTSEHAFQYLKFVNTKHEIADKIRQAFSPDDARRIAHENGKDKDPNWNGIKYQKMETVLRLKVAQNPDVKEKLLATENYIITEYCADEDTDWGLDKNNFGNNNLGKIWMKLRDELKGVKTNERK